MAEEFKSISNETLRNVEALKSSMKDIASSTNKANQALQKSQLLSADYASNFSKINQSANKFAELQDKATKSAKATADAFKEQQKQLSVVRSLNAQIDNLYDQMIRSSEQQARIIKRQVENLSAARDNAQELAREYKTLADDSSRLDKSTMWFSAFSKVVGDIPGLRKLSEPFDEAAKASRETALNNAKIKSTNESIASLSAEALKTGKGLTAEKLKELGLTEIVGNNTGASAKNILKQFQAQNKTQSVGIAGMQAGFKALGPIIKGALVPLALITTAMEIIKAVIDAMFEADKQITDLAKSLNISKESAASVRKSFFDISDRAPLLTNTLEGNLILEQDLVKTQLLFNQLLGTSVNLSSKQNEELAAQLTNANKFLKLNEEEFKGLFALYTQTGKEVDDIKLSILGTARAYKLQTGLQLDERKILGDVLKTSNAIKLSIKGGTDALIQATMKANQFGTSLDQLDKTADSLLNFEQSISNELEAELLLGRDLNLERARAAALTNDQVSLTEEVGNLVKGFGPDFEKNVLAQEAFAKTLGISRKELADMYTTYLQNEKLADTQRKAAMKFTEKEIELIKEKAGAESQIVKDMAAGTLTGLQFYDALKMAGFEGERLTEVLGELSEESLAAQSAEEKFNDILEKAKETFTRFVDGGSLDKFANFLTSFVESVNIKGFFRTIFGGLVDEEDILQANKEKAEAALKVADTDEEKAKIQKNLNEINQKLQLEYNQQHQSALEGEYGAEAKKDAEAIDRGATFIPVDISEKMATGGIIPPGYPNDTFPAHLSSNEAVIPLNEFYAKIDQLIMAVKSNQDIYIDSQKVTGALKISSYKSDYRTS